MKNYTAIPIKNLLKKKLMVAGSSGYIGSELLTQLESNNADIIGIDKIENHRENTLCVNFCDQKRVEETITEFAPDCFFHLGTNSALAYRSNLIEAYNEDSNALVNILSTIQKNSHIRFIYFSSSYVYSGLANQNAVNEDTKLVPTHNFGLAKSFFEQIIFKIHPNSVVFRLSSVFGQGNYLHPNALEIMAKECIQNNLLTVWGSGSRKMQYVFLEDVVKYILGAPKLPSGIYNIGGHNYNTVLDTAKIIAEYFGAEIKILENKKEGETLPFMENSKIIKVLNKDYFMDHSVAIKQYLDDLNRSETETIK